jgi:hypothetical protein
MVFKTYLSVLIVATLAMLCTLAPQAEAHSWIDCVDWKSSGNDKKWTNGKCNGYARRYPVKPRFASLDSASPNRHYHQSHNNVNSQPACSDGRSGEESGADETRPPKIADAYYKTSGKNSAWGKMTVTTAGDTLCVRWPAKNHAGDRDGGRVLINWMKDDMKKNHAQSVLNKHQLTTLDYSACDTASNSDIRPCGGCFKVPANSTPGTYLLQWRSRLNDDEWYTSCADVQVNK